MSAVAQVDGLALHKWSSMDHGAEFARMMLEDPFGADESMIGGIMTPRDIVHICLAMDKCWKINGWGPYAIFSEQGRFVGVIGPHPVDGVDDPVWSMHFRAEWRGQGISKIGGDLLGLPGLDRIVSFTKVSNSPARRALLQHFAYVGIREFGGEPVAWYTWEKSGSTSGKQPS